VTAVRRRLRGTREELAAQIRDLDARGDLLWLGNGFRYPDGVLTVEAEVRAGTPPRLAPRGPVSRPVPHSAAERCVDAYLSREAAQRPAEWPSRDRRWVTVAACVVVAFAVLAITSALVGVLGTLATVVSLLMLASRLFGIGGSRRSDR
jgi:hypothetical protein